MIVIPSLLSWIWRYGICRCRNWTSIKSNCFLLTNVSISELCTRIRTRRTCVGGAVVLWCVALTVVDGRAVVLEKLSGIDVVDDDGMTRDDQQTMPKLLYWLENQCGKSSPIERHPLIVEKPRQTVRTIRIGVHAIVDSWYEQMLATSTTNNSMTVTFIYLGICFLSYSYHLCFILPSYRYDLYKRTQREREKRSNSSDVFIYISIFVYISYRTCWCKPIKEEK